MRTPHSGIETKWVLTGGAGSPAKEEGGRGPARMQNRLSAHACFDAYLKNALLGGGSASAEGHFGGPKWGFRRKRTTGRECRMACRVSGTRETRFTPGFPGKLVPKGRNCKNMAFRQNPQNGRYFGPWRHTLVFGARRVGLRDLPGGRVRTRPPGAKHACLFRFFWGAVWAS